MNHSLKSWYFLKAKQKAAILLKGNKPDILLPEDVSPSYVNSALHPDLRNLISLNPEHQITLSAPALNYLWQALHKHKPSVIVEFGSGVSTRLFVNYLNFKGGGTLISVDQEEKYLEYSREGLNLEKINYFPTVAPVKSNGYDLDLKKVENVVNQYGLVDFVLVDGPKGQWMARENTLPLILKYCRQNTATWYLDDALRDSELAIIKSWMKNKNIRVKGILDEAKGLCVGSIV